MTVVERLRDALNAHDVEAMVACFHEDYRSEQPMYPDRAFMGAAQVRKNWTALFGAYPDFTATLLRSVRDGDEVWTEWEFGGSIDAVCVIIMGVRDDRIAWARLYMQTVDRGGETIDEAVQRATTT